MSNQANPTKKSQDVKKYIVFAVMFLAFAGCMYLIFAPSEKDKEKEQEGIGYNNELPSPVDSDIFSDKRNAYEQEQVNQRRQENMLNLDDYSSLMEKEQAQSTAYEEKQPPKPIESSVNTYQDINRTLGTFYQPQQNDDYEQEILALEYRIQELESAQQQKDVQQNALDEQMAIMEKSYELAARYLPKNGSETHYPNNLPQEEAETPTRNANKPAPVKVRKPMQTTVSMLKQDYSLEDRMHLYNQPRNLGFFTAGIENEQLSKNTIKACIHMNQTIVSGQSIFIRLLEPVVIENSTVPVNSILCGQAQIQGERLDIEISAIEYAGNIYPVQLRAYDMDGTRGIYIPASMEIDAAKEMLANIGTNMGTSISITDNAGSQIAADLTRGVIQGTSQLFAKKIRMVKITLKAGHRLLLMADKQS